MITTSHRDFPRLSGHLFYGGTWCVEVISSRVQSARCCAALPLFGDETHSKIERSSSPSHLCDWLSRNSSFVQFLVECERCWARSLRGSPGRQFSENRIWILLLNELPTMGKGKWIYCNNVRDLAKPSFSQVWVCVDYCCLVVMCLYGNSVWIKLAGFTKPWFLVCV